MKKTIAAVALTLGASGCLGPNNLFNSLHNWNANLTDQDWVDELVYVGLNVIPVYPFAWLADAWILNTIDYWTGNNPISDPGPFPNAAFSRK